MIKKNPVLLKIGVDAKKKILRILPPSFEISESGEIKRKHMKTQSEKITKVRQLPKHYGRQHRIYAEHSIANIKNLLDKINLSFINPYQYESDKEILDRLDSLVGHLKRHLMEAGEYELYSGTSRYGLQRNKK